MSYETDYSTLFCVHFYSIAPEVEDRAGIDLADKLKIDNRQGYFIDKPHYEK